MAITEITPAYSVSPQIAADDVAGDPGARLPVDHVQPPGRRGPGPDRRRRRCGPRPSASGSPSPTCRSSRARSTRANVADFRAAFERLPKPVLAYCRSGARCQNLWMLAGR